VVIQPATARYPSSNVVESNDPPEEEKNDNDSVDTHTANAEQNSDQNNSNNDQNNVNNDPNNTNNDNNSNDNISNDNISNDNNEVKVEQENKNSKVRASNAEMLH